MKNSIKIVIMSFLMSAILTGCSSSGLSKDKGIQLSTLSTSDKEVLQALNLQDRANVISFKGTKEVKGIKVHTYVLGKDNSWEENDPGEMRLDEAETKLLDGTFSMILNENYGIEYNIIQDKTKASYKTDKIALDKENLVSSHIFLSENKDVKVNEQIPVAIMVYSSGNSMITYCLEDYFNPQKFQGMDLVQAVVLEFAGETN